MNNEFGNRTKFIAGQRFGKAVAIEPIRIPGKQLLWKCKCDCGVEFNSLAHPLLSGKKTGCSKCSRKKYKDDFWTYVKKGKPDECWLWQRTIASTGYGTLSVNRRPFGAHRMAWILTNGPIPEGLFVCHKCDNPPCCNPSHMFLGTIRENTADMISKGRNATRFTGHKSAKVVGERFEQLVARLRSGEKQNALAREFGIHTASMNRIAKKYGPKKGALE